MPHYPRTHMQNRKRVCIICMKKATCNISHLVLERIHTHIEKLEQYDPSNPYFPTTICGSCRCSLTDISKGIKNSTLLPKIFSYERLIISENSTKCNCLICQISRKNLLSENIHGYPSKGENG